MHIDRILLMQASGVLYFAFLLFVRQAKWKKGESERRKDHNNIDST